MKTQFAAVAVIPLTAIAWLNSPVHAQAPTRSVLEGIYTETQSNRGKDLYAQKCAFCHGGDLAGSEQAPALAGVAFMAAWDGLTVGELFERIQSTMPQNAPGTLSGGQTSDIMALMFSTNKFPAGATEMPNEAGVLKQIKIDANKAASVTAMASTQQASPSGAAARPTLDYEFFKRNVQPIFAAKRPGFARCVTCHRDFPATYFHLEPPGPDGTWTEAQSRQNFESASKRVVPGNPLASKLLRHPLRQAAGGDAFHTGGKHWDSPNAPAWQTINAWVLGKTN
jgi:hypothetical protein